MIFRWLANRRLNKARSQSRLIFRFHDGQQVRSVDPVQVINTLSEHKDYLPRHLYESVNGSTEAQEIVAAAACDAFGVPAFDGKKSGLTVAERVELMLVFDAWTLALKKNIATLQTTQHFMA